MSDHLLSTPPSPNADDAPEIVPQDALTEGPSEAHVHVRMKQANHARLVRLGSLLGTKSNDETIALLLELYEVNSGTFAPTDIKDMSVLLQQLLVMLAAINATHMEILDVVRAEHRGVYAKARGFAAELQRELARVRAINFPTA